MMIQKNVMACFILVILVAGCAMTNHQGKKDIPLPPGTLNADEVRTLFSGKTVKSVLDENGRISLTYYNPNGELSQLRKGKKRMGHWRIRKDGRICLQLEERNERCRIIVKEEHAYRKYIVKIDGNHQPIITYAFFRDGNLIDQ